MVAGDWHENEPRQFIGTDGEEILPGAEPGAAVAFVGADAIGIIQVDWVQGASVSGLAAALSILTSIAAGSASPVSGPSLGTEQPTGRAV